MQSACQLARNVDKLVIIIHRVSKEQALLIDEIFKQAKNL